jgi:ABC-type antimicrobial peptide transport system permease subunit
VRAIDPRVTVLRIGLVANMFAEFSPIESSRFYALLLGLFAGLALVTAVMGLYGFLSYSVSRRTHEIGVRVALGASLARVRWLVVADALVPVVAGIAGGLAAAMGLSRLVASQLFQIEPNDPMTLAAVTALFVTVCVVAVFVPVRRATRVDPAETLRAE